MKSYSENRRADFGWGCFSGAIAMLLVSTAAYFIHCEQAEAGPTALGFLAYAPWWWVLGVSLFFGLLNTRRNRQRAADAIDALDVVDFGDFGS